MQHTSAENSSLNLQPSSLNLQPSSLNLQPSSLNLQPSSLNLQPSSLNLQHYQRSPSSKESPGSRKNSSRQVYVLYWTGRFFILMGMRINFQPKLPLNLENGLKTPQLLGGSWNPGKIIPTRFSDTLVCFPKIGPIFWGGGDFIWEFFGLKNAASPQNVRIQLRTYFPPSRVPRSEHVEMLKWKKHLRWFHFPAMFFNISNSRQFPPIPKQQKRLAKGGKSKKQTAPLDSSTPENTQHGSNSDKTTQKCNYLGRWSQFDQHILLMRLTPETTN